MSLPSIEVDLSLPPAERWNGLVGHERAIRDLMATYVRDLGGVDLFRELLVDYRDRFVPAAYREELDAVARIASADPVEVLLVNAYYDVFKHVLGCTAFAVDTEDGPLHARNLDWWSEQNALGDSSIIVRFVRAGERVFDAVTWPGFIGTLSGMAPSRFSVTMNAVLSDEPGGVALPISFLLRDLLSSASYEEAKVALEATPIACDCLLLLAGTARGEMCVVERTPSRTATRFAEHGAIFVTNDYRALEAPGWTRAERTVLEETSCKRWDRARARVHAERPSTEASCLEILEDADVRMVMTVQQMVMSAARGTTFARNGAR